MREGTLFAATFDVRRLEISGAPVPVLEHVSGAPSNGGAQFSVSDTGMIAYVEGAFAINQLSLTWLDRQGNFEPFPAGVDAREDLRFSPDGTRIAVDRIQVGGLGVWIYDWKRNTMTRLTFERDIQCCPIWTPDGSRVAYGAYGSAQDSINSNLYWRRADGSGEPERLLHSPNSQWPGSFHPSRKWLAYEEDDPQTKADIWILPLKGDEQSGWKPGKPQAFLRTPYMERHPAFSPDGRWIAYDSDESGTFEVYVRPFPGPGGKSQISSGGGIYPVWSAKGNQLYYRNSNRQIMIVPFRTASDSFLAGNPELWSKGQFGMEGQMSFYFSFPPDEKRAVVLTPPVGGPAGGSNRLNFIVNFFEELRRKVPARAN